MDILFILGVLGGSLILLQLELILIMLLLALGHIYPMLDTPMDLLAIITGLILLIGHIKAIVFSYNNAIPISHEYIGYKAKDPFNLLENVVWIGAFWRVKQEWKYIKEIASLNFK